MREREEKTVLTQRDADRRLGERLHDVTFWRSELQVSIGPLPGKPYGRGRLCTVHLLVLTSLDQLLLYLKYYLHLLQNKLP
jgi:hypothetical protein